MRSLESGGGGLGSLRTVLLGCLVCFVVLVTIVVGMRVPASLIEPEVDAFRGEEGKIARAFYSYEMWRGFSEGPEAHLLTGARVTEVERCPNAGAYDPRSTLPYGTAIRGTIWAHTVFGIQYRKIEASCGRAAVG